VPTRLNLASKPFTNRSLPWAVTAVVIFVSLIALFFIVRATRQTSVEAQAIQNDINRLRQQEQTLRQQAEAVKASLTPQQQQTLTAAHTLLDRKHFSWSLLFADLEAALPGNVRVKRIAVRGVTKQGDQVLTELELDVIAKSPSTVTEMIAQMDRTGIFRAEIRSQNLQTGRGETGAEYELFVVYRPRAGAASEPTSIAAIPDSAIREEMR
jgi:Tfp pilus assembly protein PilN